jgi:ATP-dependent DNA helicase DinG
MMARLEHIKQHGGNGFIEHQLPTAVLSLKQGVGRLLRDQNDYGLIVICDNRIQNKSYGAVFKKSLAPMRFTDDRHKISQFLESHQINNHDSKQ